MKKLKTTVIALTAIVLLLSQLTAAAADKIFDTPDNVSANDYSGVMQPSTITYIQSRNEVLMNETKSKIIFVTVPTTGTESIDDYAQRLYNAWSVAYTGDNSSVFILLATDDMQYWPMVGSHIESALTPEIVNDFLLKYLEPDFAKKDFDAAIRKTYDAFANWYSGTFNASIANTPNVNNTDNQSNKAPNPVLSAVGAIFRILLVAALVLLVLFIYIRRKIRLKQIARRKRMRRAKIEKYRSAEPTEQYSFSYSAIRDDDDM